MKPEDPRESKELTHPYLEPSMFNRNRRHAKDFEGTLALNTVSLYVARVLLLTGRVACLA